MEQMFGANNRYIQDDGRGHEMIICALWPVNSGENTGSFRKIAKRGGKLTVRNLGGPHTVVLTCSQVPGRREEILAMEGQIFAPLCPPPSK